MSNAPLALREAVLAMCDTLNYVEAFPPRVFAEMDFMIAEIRGGLKLPLEPDELDNRKHRDAARLLLMAVILWRDKGCPTKDRNLLHRTARMCALVADREMSLHQLRSDPRKAKGDAA